MLIALLTVTLAHADDLNRITLSCGGIDEDELSCINEPLPEVCRFSDEDYSAARKTADANGDGVIQDKERAALLDALNAHNKRRRGCMTIKIVTDGR